MPLLNVHCNILSVFIVGMCIFIEHCWEWLDAWSLGCVEHLEGGDSLDVIEYRLIRFYTNAMKTSERINDLVNRYDHCEAFCMMWRRSGEENTPYAMDIESKASILSFRRYLSLYWLSHEKDSRCPSDTSIKVPSRSDSWRRFVFYQRLCIRWVGRM